MPLTWDVPTGGTQDLPALPHCPAPNASTGAMVRWHEHTVTQNPLPIPCQSHLVDHTVTEGKSRLLQVREWGEECPLSNSSAPIGGRGIGKAHVWLQHVHLCHVGLVSGDLPQDVSAVVRGPPLVLMGPLGLHRQVVADLARECHPLPCGVAVILLWRRGLLKLGKGRGRGGTLSIRTYELQPTQESTPPTYVHTPTHWRAQHC